jgi:uncharacterized membrane protein
MAWMWGVVGAIAGLVVGGLAGSVAGLALAGAFIGLLVARQSVLAARLRRAEVQLADLWSTRAQEEATAPPAALAAAVPAPVAYAAVEAPSVTATPPRIPLPPDAGVLDLRTLADVPGAPPVPMATVPPLFPDTPAEVGESTAERVVAAIKRWFTEGNVPVKVGMLVLFAGVAALLKYAAEEGWLTLPVELRLAGIGIAAIAALGFGWRQRHARRAFALSLQGGAIGVLLLTVFAAYRLYGLLPVGATFALMLVLVAGVGLLAVLQDALALAVLGLLAGFAAPILLSTGAGNHVVLFSYYALLNLAILAVAWVRPWRVLNLLGFFFTFAIGTAWGVLRYDPAQFASTEPFLVFHFLLYLAIPILFALRSAPMRAGAIDGTLVFGMPLIAFALQAGLLDGERLPLALSALALAVTYLVLAWALLRRVRLLGESFAVLAVGFATLAVPLAFSARVSGCVFALEGAALIWLGLRQGRRLPQISGLLLQLAAAGAMSIAFIGFDASAPIFANARFIAAVLIAGAAMTSAWLYLRAQRHAALSGVLYAWGLLWWLGALLAEIDRAVPPELEAAATLAAIALTTWLAAEAQRHWRRAALAWTAAAGLWAGLPLAIAIATHGQPLAGWPLAAHVAYAIAGARSLVCLRESSALAPAHLGWLWTWTVVFALALDAVAQSLGLGDGWRLAATSVPLIAMHALALRAPNLLAWPVAERVADHRRVLLGSQAVVLAMAFVGGLFSAGGSQPLPFVPLLNPLELSAIGTLVVTALWLRSEHAGTFARQRPLLLAAGAFAFVTAATLRAAHHLAGAPWDIEGVLSSSVSQTSLAVVWSVLGVAGWVIGSRRGQRGLWLAGAALMAIVLLKLLLIDRQHLGNLFGIASFIAYGLLCTLIGYLAPAPPRSAPAQSAA